MNLSGEKDVFLACKKWAAAVCDRNGLDKMQDENVRGTLDDALTLIRFPLMSSETFTRHVAPDKLLLDKEKVLILMDIINGEAVSEFPKEGRDWKGKPFDVFRMKNVESGHDDRGQRVEISFHASKSVSLTHVSLYMSCEEGEISGSVEVLLDYNKCLSSKYITLTYTRNDMPKCIQLEKPLVIQPNTHYDLRGNFRGVQSFHGKDDCGANVSGNIKITLLGLNAGLLHGFRFQQIFQ